MAPDAATLIVGPRWVGDMVMAQALLKALKASDPDRPIDVMAPAWALPLAARMPEVRAGVEAPFARGALDLDARFRIGRSLRGRYDQAYVLQGSWKSALVPFFAQIPRRIGYRREFRYGLLNDVRVLPGGRRRKTAWVFQALVDPGEVRAPRLSVDPANQARLLDRFGLEAGRFVAMMPGAEFGPAKRWPETSYAAVAREMMARGFAVAALGSANDRATAEAICEAAPGVRNLCGETALVDAVDILAAAHTAITNDSGLMHVAAAVGTPIVAVYGPTAPGDTPPLSTAAELVTLGLDCAPCHRKVCPLGHHNCMNQLAPALVLDALAKLETAA